MSQNEFYTAVVDGILDYFPEDYQDAKVLIAEQTKSGDVKVHGLSITKKENTISPVLNLDSFYDSYLRGEDMNHIMRTIAATYVQAIRKQPDIDIPDFSKEGLEKNVLIRAIDRNANENFLKERPYIDLGCGYVGTMYVPMEVNENRAMVQLTYGNLDSVGIDPDALFEKAVENTEKMQPAVFANMEEILFAPDPEPNPVPAPARPAEDIVETDARGRPVRAGSLRALLRRRVAGFLHGGALGGERFLHRVAGCLPPRMRRRAEGLFDECPFLGLNSAAGVRGAS